MKGYFSWHLVPLVLSCSRDIPGGVGRGEVGPYRGKVKVLGLRKNEEDDGGDEEEGAAKEGKGAMDVEIFLHDREELQGEDNEKTCDASG